MTSFDRINIEHFRELIENDKIQYFFDQIKKYCNSNELSDNYTLLVSNWRRLEKENNVSTISRDSYSAISAKINKSLLQFLREVESEYNTSENGGITIRARELLNRNFQAVNNFKVNDGIYSYQGIEALRLVTQKLYRELEEYLVHLGRINIVYHIDLFTGTQYSKLFEALYGYEYATKFDDLKAYWFNLVTNNDSNVVWDHLKTTLGNKGKENLEIKEALKQIAQVLFYKVEFDYRIGAYQMSCNKIIDEYAPFIDSYVNRVYKYFSTPEEKKRSQEKLSYFDSEVSSFEILLLFYYIMTKQNAPISVLNGVNWQRLTDSAVHSLIIDIPSLNEINDDINMLKV